MPRITMKEHAELRRQLYDAKRGLEHATRELEKTQHQLANAETRERQWRETAERAQKQKVEEDQTNTERGLLERFQSVVELPFPDMAFLTCATTENGKLHLAHIQFYDLRQLLALVGRLQVGNSTD